MGFCTPFLQIGGEERMTFLPYSGNSCTWFLAFPGQYPCIWGHSYLWKVPSRVESTIKVLYSTDSLSLDMERASLYRHFKIPMQQENKRPFNCISVENQRSDCTKLLPSVPEGCLPPTCEKAPKFSVNVNEELNVWGGGKQCWNTMCQSLILYD